MTILDKGDLSLRIQRDIVVCGFPVYGFVIGHDSSRIGMLTKGGWEEFSEEEAEKHPFRRLSPCGVLRRDYAQELFNDLWRGGLRPSDAAWGSGERDLLHRLVDQYVIEPQVLKNRAGVKRIEVISG